MPSPNQLPPPWQARRDTVWDELVDFDFYNRFHGEIQRDSQVLAERWADETLERVGRPRLTSKLFWSIYDVMRSEGLGATTALRYAVSLTPELG
jgi:hypothetical protein